MSTRAVLVAGICLIGARCQPAFADISYSIHARAGVVDGQLNTDVYDEGFDDSTSIGTAMLSKALGGQASIKAGTADASVSVTVGMGYIRMKADASTNVNVHEGYTWAGTATASASFSDTMVISAPGMSGLTGTFTPKVHVITAGQATSVGSARYQVDFTIADQWVESLGDISGGGSAFYLELPPVTFVYDTPFSVSASAWIDATVTGNAEDQGRGFNGSASAAFPGSIRWMGMEGLPADAYISQGAINWLKAAPTPAPAGAAPFLGIAALAAARRRRAPGTPPAPQAR